MDCGCLNDHCSDDETDKNKEEPTGGSEDDDESGSAMEAANEVKTEEDDVEKLYGLQHYDSEEEDGQENFAGAHFIDQFYLCVL